MADTRIPKNRTPRTPQSPRRHVEPKPIQSGTYVLLGQWNTSMESAIADLEALNRVPYLKSEEITHMLNLLRRIQAQASRAVIMVLHDRCMDTAGAMDRLVMAREKITGLGEDS